MRAARRAAATPQPCMRCGHTVTALPDRNACKTCREVAFRWWASLHVGMHPTLYQRAFNVAFGTPEGLRATVMAATS